MITCSHIGPAGTQAREGRGWGNGPMYWFFLCKLSNDILTTCLSCNMQRKHVLPAHQDFSNHWVIILNRGSMFAFQWREFSPHLSSAHTLFQCYHSQWEIGDAAIAGKFPLSSLPLGPLANESAISSDVVTLWRCTFWTGKFASVSSYSIVKACSL